MSHLNRRRLLQLSGAAALVTAAGGAHALQATLSDDMALLRAAMEVHPGALRYLNPAALDAALDQLEQEFAQEDALDQRYLALSRFLSKLKCGHSYANFFNQSAEVQRALFTRNTRLPFAFRWLGETMVVTEAAPGVDLPRGTVIHQINGVAAAQMLADLLPYTRADGTALGKRKALLEVQHRSRLEFFDVFHGLVYGTPESGQYEIVCTPPSGQRRTVRVAPISLADRRAMREAKRGPTSRTDPLWQFEVRDGIGILTMPGWSTYNTDWDWQTWLDARLDDVAGLRGLVIDNRDNEGGNPEVGDRLMSRLITDPVPMPQYARLVRFQSLPDIIRENAYTWNDSFYTIGSKAEPVGRGFYALSSGPAAQTRIEPRGQTVTTPAVLLTSPTNSSAGFNFAVLAQETGRMRLVGQTTGGNRKGINGDGYFFATLPQSGIEFDIPIVGQYPYTPQPDAGVTPEIEITETVEDIAMGRDATMERAFSLL